MGEFDEGPEAPLESESDAGTGTGAGSVADPATADEATQGSIATAGTPAVTDGATQSPAPRWRVRARRPLDQEQLLAEVEPGTIEASRVLALHRTM